MHTSKMKVLINLEDILGPDCTVVSTIMIVIMSKIRLKISLAKIHRFFCWKFFLVDHLEKIFQTKGFFTINFLQAFQQNKSALRKGTVTRLCSASFECECFFNWIPSFSRSLMRKASDGVATGNKTQNILADNFEKDGSEIVLLFNIENRYPPLRRLLAFGLFIYCGFNK